MSRYPAKTTTDADCANDIALLVDTSALAESLLQAWRKQQEQFSSTWTRIK